MRKRMILKMTTEKSEAVNRKKENAMAKRKKIQWPKERDKMKNIQNATQNTTD